MNVNTGDVRAVHKIDTLTFARYSNFAQRRVYDRTHLHLLALVNTLVLVLFPCVRARVGEKIWINFDREFTDDQDLTERLQKLYKARRSFILQCVDAAASMPEEGARSWHKLRQKSVEDCQVQRNLL